MKTVLTLKFVDDEPCVYFDDESWHDSDRSEVRRTRCGMWQRGGYDSYMADDEWETLEGSESRRLEDEFQRLVKTGDVEDIDTFLDRPRWIPAADELPAIGRSVIIFCPLLEPREIIGARRYSPSEGWSVWVTDDGQELGETEPSHWMPLPSPPEVIAPKLTPESVALLREQWDALHKGPPPEVK